MTVCSPELENKISNWEVSQECTLSDHNKIKFPSAGKTPNLPFRNPRKTYWIKFRDELSQRMGTWKVDTSTAQLIDWSVEKFTESVTGAYEASCPLRLPKVKKRNLWFSKELGKLNKKCNEAWRSRKTDWETFQECRRTFRTACRKAKREAFREWCNSIEGVSETSRMHKILSKDRSSQVCSLRKTNGEYTSDKREMLDLFLSSSFPDCENLQVPDDTSLTAEDFPKISESVKSDARHICTSGSVRWAVYSFSPYKSPGPDGILPVFMQQGIDLIEYSLFCIFTACLATGYIPKLWRNIKARTSLNQAKEITKTSEAIVVSPLFS